MAITGDATHSDGRDKLNLELRKRLVLCCSRREGKGGKERPTGVYKPVLSISIVSGCFLSGARRRVK